MSEPYQSPFQRVLKDILSTPNTYTDKDWAMLLRVTSQEMEAWLSTNTPPPPDRLRTIIRTAKEDPRFAEPLERLNNLMDRPIQEVLGYNSRDLERTLGTYILRPVKEGFLRHLSTLSSARQEEVLYAASALCTGSHSTY